MEHTGNARMHHMGITVSDTQATVDFYRLIAEIEVTGPLVKSGPAVDAVTGRQGAVILITFVAFAPFDGRATVIELAEYRGDPEPPLDPVNSRVGAAHPAIVVPSIEEAAARVSDAGYAVTAAPQIATSGPLEGFRYTYVIGPDRVRVELLEEPVTG